MSHQAGLLGWGLPTPTPFGVANATRKAGTSARVAVDHDPIGFRRGQPAATTVSRCSDDPSTTRIGRRCSWSRPLSRSWSPAPGARAPIRRAAASRPRSRPLVRADVRRCSRRLRQLRCPGRDGLGREPARVGQPAGERPGPGAVRGRLLAAGRDLDARRSGSSTPTTTRTSRATSPPSAASTACRPARRRTAASRRSTRPAARATRRRTAAGRSRSHSTSRRSHGICPSCKILLVEASSKSFAEPRRRGERGGRARRERRLQLLGRRRVVGRDARSTRLLQPPRRRHHRLERRPGYGVEYPAASPYVVAVGGTTLSVNAGPGSYSGAGDGLGRRGLGLLRVRVEAGLQKDTAAPSGRSSMSRPTPIPTAAPRSTTPTARRLGPGRRHLARLAADRSRLRAERQHERTARRHTATRSAARRDERLERQLQPAPTCARPASGTTARPVSGRPTAWRPSAARAPPPPPAPDFTARRLAVEPDRHAGPARRPTRRRSRRTPVRQRQRERVGQRSPEQRARPAR